MFTLTRALEEALRQHFIYQKVEIAYAIHKPFPFFEGLRDKLHITERMYLESLEACQNLVPVSKVVHNVLTKLERKSDLSFLMALFSPVNLREYPNLMSIQRSFGAVVDAYGGWSRACTVTFAAPDDPEEGSSNVRPPHWDPHPWPLPLPQLPGRPPRVLRVHQLEASTQKSSKILGKSPSPSGFVHDGRITPAPRDILTAKKIVEGAQEMPSPPSGSAQGKKRKGSVQLSPDKRQQKESLLRVSERPEDKTLDFLSPQLPVTCGEAKGVLYKEKMKQGPSEKCIQNEKGAWFTPKEFEIAGNRSKSKNWKRSVLCRGQTLGQLLEKGLLLCPSRVGLKEQEERDGEADTDSAIEQGFQEVQSSVRSVHKKGTHGHSCGLGPRKVAGQGQGLPQRSISVCIGDGSDGGSPQLKPVTFPSRSSGPRPRRSQAADSSKRIDCPALPPGWKREEVIRKSGLSAGKSDVYYYSPHGEKIRSKVHLVRYLGNTVDLSNFNYKTGKMI